jgi:hypothetical protein
MIVKDTSFSAGKDFRRMVNRVCKLLRNIGPVRLLTCIQVAAGREVLLGKEDLPKFATGPVFLRTGLSRQFCALLPE